MTTDISEIPQDILVKIFSYFTPKQLTIQLAFVCKKWLSLMHSAILWRRLELIVSDLSKCHDRIHKILSQASSSLKYFSFDVKEEVGPEFLHTFPSLPSILTLDLSFVRGLTDEMINVLIAQCPNVSKFSLEGSKTVNGATVDHICTGWACLVELNLSHCVDVDNAALKRMARNLHYLQSVNLDGIINANDEVVDLLVEYHGTRLRYLWLDGAELTDLSLFSLQRCRYLEFLSFSFGDGLTDNAIGYLRKIPKLRHIHIRKLLNVSSEAMDSICVGNVFSNLQYLSLYECCSLTDVGVCSLTLCCPQLKSLCLAWCGLVSELGVTYIVERCRSLVLLDLVGVHTARGYCFNNVPQSNLPLLKYLDLRSANMIIDDILVKLVQRAPDIVVLDYYGELVLPPAPSDEETGPSVYAGFYLPEIRDWLKKYEGHCCLQSLF